MKRILVGLFCLAGLAAGQAAFAPAKVAESPKWIQKVFDVKYADPNAIAKLLGSLPNNYGPNLDRVVAQPELHAVSVGTTDPSFLKLAEDIIQRFDVPQAKPATASQQRGVEIVASILLAGPKGSSGDALPADLAPVSKQLHAAFGYTDIRLLDSALIRGRENRTSDVTGTLDGLLGEKSGNQIYRIRIQKISVEPKGKGDAIGLEGFAFSARIPVDAGQNQYTYMELGFNTDLNLLEGQKVVVGKTRIGSTNQALILVLSARLVD